MIGISLLAPLVFLWAAVPSKSGAPKLRKTTSFAKYANGVIASPNVTSAVEGTLECAGACQVFPYCMGFSLTDGVTCKLGFGSFAWTNDARSTLYGVDVSPLDGYTFQADGRFYKKYDERLTYTESMEACDRDGAALADTYGQLARDIVGGLLSAYSGIQIVQGIYRTSDHATGRWANFKGDVFYSAQNLNDPNQKWYLPGNEPSDDQCCTVTVFPSTNVFEWDASSCAINYSLPRICQKPIGYALAPNGKYYKMHYDRTSSHEDAQKICASEGGNLADLLTQENYDAVEAYRLRTRFGVRAYMKVGGTEAGHTDTWIMPDGVTTYTSSQVPNWSQGDPNAANEECVSFDSNSLGLQDVSCYTAWEGKFLCEIVP